MDHLSNYIVRNAVDAENKSLRNILSNLMVNSLAELYNLDGKGVEGKESFRALKMYEVVRGNYFYLKKNIAFSFSYILLINGISLSCSCSCVCI